MSGIFGIFDNNDDIVVTPFIFTGLFALQHRGQESCGIAVSDKNEIKHQKSMGLVGDVFTPSRMEFMKGSLGIGHVQYSTIGESIPENIQPLFFECLDGKVAIVNNGNLTNTKHLKNVLLHSGAILQTTSDTELLAHIISNERLWCNSLEEAVSRTMKRVEGAYSMLVMNKDSIIAVRDPHGIRPLCMGKCKHSYVFSSESCAFDATDTEFLRDIKPGEIVAVNKEGCTINEENCNSKKPAHCIFEHIYFARQDSFIDSQSVIHARMEAGRLLARQEKIEADIVIGVPDSGVDAAIGYSQESGIPYGRGFVKNNYIGRTFINPNPKKRAAAVRIKLNPLAFQVKGKRVIMIDDSIVRGTTSVGIVKMLKDAGAKEVHVCISSPPFLWPCFYGPDVPSTDQLAARIHSIDEIKKQIDADTLLYLDADLLKDMVGGDISNYCDACFTGNYPTKIT